MYRVTKAFAPLIIKSKGRISVIGSISGTLSDATWGPYAMTKFAMEASADALADEMKQFDVRVSLIEPGAYRSNIGKSALDRIVKQDQSAANTQFKKQMNESLSWLNYGWYASRSGRLVGAGGPPGPSAPHGIGWAGRSKLLFPWTTRSSIVRRVATCGSS